MVSFGSLPGCAVKPETSVCVRFGDFELDVKPGELLCRQTVILVQEQSHRRLPAPIERDGRLLAREELQEQLWPHGAHVEFDLGINLAIKAATVLRDLAEQPEHRIGPTMSINSNIRKERTMRRLSIVLALSTLLLTTICSAQQTTQNTSANATQQNPASPPSHGCLTDCLTGGGAGGYFGLWNPQSLTTTQVMTAAPMAVNPSCVPITPPPSGCVVSGDPIDVESSTAAFYEIHGSPVLSVGPETSDHNVFVGVNTGTNNMSGSGVRNSCVGHGSCNANTTGTDNSFLGDGSGNANIAGSFNTYIGSAAGINNVGSSNIYLGYGAGQFQSSENNTIRVGGNSQIDATFIAGIANTTLTGGVPVFVDPDSGRLGTMASSSLRFKEQVRDMGDSTNALMKLRAVTFFYKSEYANGPHTLQYGLIAEEVAKVYPELVAYDSNGQPSAVRYQYIATMLLNEVQKQYQRSEAQADQIKAQQQEIDGLKQQLQVQNAALQERLSRLETLVRTEVAAAQ